MSVLKVVKWEIKTFKKRGLDDDYHVIYNHLENGDIVALRYDNLRHYTGDCDKACNSKGL